MPPGRPNTIYGFEPNAFAALSPEEQERLKSAVREDNASDDKHRKRAQRSAAHINRVANNGIYATVIQRTEPLEAVIDLTDDDPTQIVRNDLVRALWSVLPMEYHLVAVFRTLNPEASLESIAEASGVSVDTARNQLAHMKHLLPHLSKGLNQKKAKALLYLSRGLSVRETARLCKVHWSTVQRWKNAAKN